MSSKLETTYKKSTQLFTAFRLTSFNNIYSYFILEKKILIIFFARLRKSSDFGIWKNRKTERRKTNNQIKSKKNSIKTWFQASYFNPLHWKITLQVENPLPALFIVRQLSHSCHWRKFQTFYAFRLIIISDICCFSCECIFHESIMGVPGKKSFHQNLNI